MVKKLLFLSSILLTCGHSFAQDKKHDLGRVSFDQVLLPRPFCDQTAVRELTTFANVEVDKLYQGTHTHKAQEVLEFSYSKKKKQLKVEVPIVVSRHTCPPGGRCGYTQIKDVTMERLRSRLQEDLNADAAELGVVFEITMKNLLTDKNESIPVDDAIHLHFRDSTDPVWKKLRRDTATLRHIQIKTALPFTCDTKHSWGSVMRIAGEHFKLPRFDALLALDDTADDKPSEDVHSVLAHEATHFILQNSDAYNLKEHTTLTNLNAFTCVGANCVESEKRKFRTYDPVEILIFVLRFDQSYDQERWANYIDTRRCTN